MRTVSAAFKSAWATGNYFVDKLIELFLPVSYSVHSVSSQVANWGVIAINDGDRTHLNAFGVSGPGYYPPYYGPENFIGNGVWKTTGVAPQWVVLNTGGAKVGRILIWGPAVGDDLSSSEYMGIQGIKVQYSNNPLGPWTDITTDEYQRAEAFELYNGRSVTSIAANVVTVVSQTTINPDAYASWPSIIDLVFISNITANYIRLYVTSTGLNMRVAVCEVELFRREEITSAVQSIETSHAMDITLLSITAREANMKMKNGDLLFTKQDFQRPTSGQLSVDSTPEAMIWFGINGEMVKQGWFAVDTASFDSIARTIELNMRSRTERNMFDKTIATWRYQIGLSDAIELSTMLSNIGAGMVAVDKNGNTVPVFAPNDSAHNVIEQLMVASGEKGVYVDNDGLIKTAVRSSAFWLGIKPFPNLDTRTDHWGSATSTLRPVPPLQQSIFFDLTDYRKLWFPEANRSVLDAATGELEWTGADNLSVWDVTRSMTTKVYPHYLFEQARNTYSLSPGGLSCCFSIPNIMVVHSHSASSVRSFFQGGAWPINYLNFLPGAGMGLPVSRWTFNNGAATVEKRIKYASVLRPGDSNPLNQMIAACASPSHLVNTSYVWVREPNYNYPAVPTTSYRRFDLVSVFQSTTSNPIVTWLGYENAGNIRDMVIAAVSGHPSIPDGMYYFYVKDNSLIRWKVETAFSTRVDMGSVFPTPINSGYPVVTKIAVEYDTKEPERMTALWFTGVATSSSGYLAWDYPMPYFGLVCKWNLTTEFSKRAFIGSSGGPMYCAGAAATKDGVLYFVNNPSGNNTNPPELLRWDGVNGSDPVNLGYANWLGGTIPYTGTAIAYPNLHTGMAISRMKSGIRHIAAWNGGSRRISVWRIRVNELLAVPVPSETIPPGHVLEMAESISYELGGAPSAIGAVEVQVTDVTVTVSDPYTVSPSNASHLVHVVKMSSPADPLSLVGTAGVVLHRRHALYPVISSPSFGGTLRGPVMSATSSVSIFGNSINQDPMKKTTRAIPNSFVFDGGTAANLAAAVLSETKQATDWPTIEVPLMPHVELGDLVTLNVVQRTGPKPLLNSGNYIVSMVSHKITINEDDAEARTVLELKYSSA